MPRYEIHSCEQMIELIQQLGFLPLLVSGIPGYSAEEMADEECRYVVFPDGGWDWPLWKWKGIIINESDCVYGKFFNGKAGFISRSWWTHFCNWRRSLYPMPENGSIEGIIYQTLCEQDSIINRDLRAACGFSGPKMRSKFDGYVTILQMATRVVTEDFVYPRDKHNREYGWGWSLLTTPERLYGKDACSVDCSPEESYELMTEHLRTILPLATDKQISKLLKYIMTRETDNLYHDMLNSGEMYDSVDDQFIAYQHELVQKLNEFNRTDETPEGLAKRDEMLRDMCGTYGENLYIIPPIHANCGLRHIHFGKNVVVNFNCMFVDDGDIFIGDDVMIGPGCCLATSIHPVSPKLRKYKIQRNKSIRLGNNVWLGAGAIILPGVTIGDNSIVGAGAVVAKDVPANSIVVGNPAKVLRQITEDDDRFEGGKPIPQELIDKYM